MIPYRDNITTLHTPWVTWVLMGINFVLFLLTWFMPEASLTSLLYRFGLVPARFTYPTWAQLSGLSLLDFVPFVTSMFLHSSWLHILLNMWLLWIFGDNVEDRMGPWRFVCFYLLCGIVAGLVQINADPKSTIPAIGASGALAGIMGAYFFLYPYARIVIWVLFLPIFVEVPAISFVGAWVIFQLYKATTGVPIGTGVPDVGWWGHLGGFITGALIYRLFLRHGPTIGFEPSSSHSS